VLNTLGNFLANFSALLDLLKCYEFCLFVRIVNYTLYFELISFSACCNSCYSMSLVDVVFLFQDMEKLRQEESLTSDSSLNSAAVDCTQPC